MTAAHDHYRRFEQHGGTLVDEREYLLVTGTRH
jgi:hypothetical protein